MEYLFTIRFDPEGPSSGNTYINEQLHVCLRLFCEYT